MAAVYLSIAKMSFRIRISKVVQFNNNYIE
ncbi:MAG: hypothetical protein ACD_80C00131G0007 [uncultured bacterium (gcode 4)]|uniref:Uncharacterized protein n=1 Tax=uncultured bacterium (gcode 4) TaxID=1234023 RepID=K1YI13_9BACT|nr:MAG: hypothetical protein ACD_80C00131G0007 [uncultured bacterium (gcode 4)]